MLHPCLKSKYPVHNLFPLLRLKREGRYWLGGHVRNESWLLVRGVGRGNSRLLRYLGRCEGRQEEREHAERKERGEDVDDCLFH